MRQRGDYKLRKVAGRASHFAHVELILHTQDDPLIGPTQEAEGAPAGWVAAAREGALQAIRHATATSAASSPRVHLLSCEGTPADTDVDTIWCAAFMAALSVVDPGRAAEPTFHMQDRRWHVLLDGRDDIAPPANMLEMAAQKRV